jgi:rubrerythrin
MNIEQAIQTAIAYETKVSEAYARAAGRVQDPAGRRIFEVLTEEEKGHLAYLNHKLEQLRQTGHVTPDALETAIPSRQKIEAAEQSLQAKMAAIDPDNDLQMLEQALNLEIETSGFYQRMVKELPPEGQKFFARFVEIEEGHVAIVQAEMDHIAKSGYWFNFREVDLDGA